MWRYVTGCLRDTLQRSANYFDIRCGAGLASNQQTSVAPRKENAIRFFEDQHRCSGNADEKDTRRNDNSWYQDHLNANYWANAFTLSGAIVLGWYASQVMCLAHRRHSWENKPKPYCRILGSYLHASVLPHLAFAQPPTSQGIAASQDIINSTVPENVSNDAVLHDANPNNQLDNAINELTDVVSSIENKLGLAAIERGELSSGLAMLHSAAQRKHAPALYNLALCYEQGLGLKRDEKMAVELYQAAASQDHAAALYNLAVFQGQGRGGLTQDSHAAESLLRRAAARGQPEARHALASIRSPPLVHNFKVSTTDYRPNSVVTC